MWIWCLVFHFISWLIQCNHHGGSDSQGFIIIQTMIKALVIITLCRSFFSFSAFAQVQSTEPILWVNHKPASNAYELTVWYFTLKWFDQIIECLECVSAIVTSYSQETNNYDTSEAAENPQTSWWSKGSPEIREWIGKSS